MNFISFVVDGNSCSTLYCQSVPMCEYPVHVLLLSAHQGQAVDYMHSQTARIPLASGTLLIMEGATQADWQVSTLSKSKPNPSFWHLSSKRCRNGHTCCLRLPVTPPPPSFMLLVPALLKLCEQSGYQDCGVNIASSMHINVGCVHPR